MAKSTPEEEKRWVALRKESVDRNPNIKAMRGDRKASLSARRAWIEIGGVTVFNTDRYGVALRKESVDRNRFWRQGPAPWQCRSPQGERG